MFLGSRPVEEVLDVGAGSGVFTRHLIDFGLARRGVCVDPGYEVERVEIHDGCEIAFVHGVDEVPQNLILMMDVLEHVDDDIGLIRKYTDRMPINGRLLITVPAFQYLWSGHDVFLEHRRRYTLSSLEKVVQKAGLRVLKGRYFFGSLFPVVAAIRLWDRLQLRTGKSGVSSHLRPESSFVNTTLVHIHDVERATLFTINRLAGLTVFCLAKRD